jgi:hypothetical protein
MTILLGFYKSTWWYFGQYNSKLFVVSTPLFQFIICKGDMLQDLHDRLGITIKEVRNDT